MVAGLLSCPPTAPAGVGADVGVAPGTWAPLAAAAGCASMSILALRGRLRRVRPCHHDAPLEQTLLLLACHQLADSS